MATKHKIMSDEDNSDTHLLTAEYKDGQLQIVEMNPFERPGADKNTSILPDDGEDLHKYIEVLDPKKGLVQLDLLNLTLVRCDDGEESYRLVTNSESDGGNISSDATVTCVLQSSDGEEPDPEQESYVMVGGGDGGAPLMLYRSLAAAPAPAAAPARAAEHTATSSGEEEPKPKQAKKSNLKPAEILERMKALQKARNIMASHNVRVGRRGRRGLPLPPPHELLASPDFRLYLYSCKMCDYKCNAVKELQQHRATEHGGRASVSSVGASAGPAGGPRRAPRHSPVQLQCPRCPYRATSQALHMKHAQTHEETKMIHKVSLDSKEVEEADVLVCGACGYESGDRSAFRRHIEREHGATTD